MSREGLLKSEKKICFSCHPETEKELDGVSNHEPFANVECTQCHDSDRLTETTGLGVQDIIQNGIAVRCLDCLTDRFDIHGGTANGDYGLFSAFNLFYGVVGQFEKAADAERFVWFGNID